MIIKYRCWDKKHKLWRKPDPDNMVGMFAPTTRNAMYIAAGEQYEFLLWTGFEDVNGVDVYAGDILDETYHVDWDILNGRWGLYELNSKILKYTFTTYPPRVHLVTGTVFE